MSIFYKDQRLTHMSTRDAYLWTKFLDAYPDKYFNFIYDIRVGDSVKLPDEAPDWIKKCALKLSQRRIDLTMEDKQYLYVTEVRYDATASVIGTLTVYRYLYIARFNPIKPVLPYLITNSVDADLLIILRDLSIPFTVV